MTEDSLANRMLKAQSSYSKLNEDYLIAEADYESEKKLLECKLAVYSINDGKTETEKKRLALAHPEYREEVEKLNELLKTKNNRRAGKEGADSLFRALQSALSYEKSLIEKNIYLPK